MVLKSISLANFLTYILYVKLQLTVSKRNIVFNRHSHYEQDVLQNYEKL